MAGICWHKPGAPAALGAKIKAGRSKFIASESLGFSQIRGKPAGLKQLGSVADCISKGDSSVRLDRQAGATFSVLLYWCWAIISQGCQALSTVSSRAVETMETVKLVWSGEKQSWGL